MRSQAAVFSTSHEIKKDLGFIQPTAALVNEDSTVKKILRGNFSPAYEQGIEWWDVRCLETSRCYTGESICSKSDQE